VRVADLYADTQDRPAIFEEAARKIGLTTREYAEFRQALAQGSALYVRLPRHIDAMSGVHRRNGQVYVLHNVLVPAGSVGWQVNLADGTTVLVPRVCGNLSMNRSRMIAKRPQVVALRQPKAVRATQYVAPVAPTPVTFDAPQAVAAAAPVAAPVAPAVTSAARRSLLPFLGLLAPIAASLPGSPSSPGLPTCTAGSNSVGACQR
jgi:hypothetical protein